MKIRRLGAVLAALLILAAAPLARAEGPNDVPTVPNPRVVGPVQGGLRGHPFAGGPFDYAAHGYVEEEYFFGGTAQALSSGGGLAPSVAALGPAPYQTRMVVRRPADPARFNGTAVLEWFNVTEGGDIDTCYTAQWEEAFRGYAWVSVSVQQVGHTVLKAWDPVRYARLVHPGDAYAADIWAQAAKAVRDPLGMLPPTSVDPMGGLDVERVIGCGNSQSGNTLDAYINKVAGTREKVFDAFQVQAAVDGLHVIADELQTPILRTFTENELGRKTNQSDSAYYRQWDFGSSAHADSDFANYERTVTSRDMGLPIGVWPTAAMDITPSSGCMPNAYPKNDGMEAALHALDQWLRSGQAPTSIPRVVLNSDGSLARDAVGNAVGGVRLPAIEVPLGAHHGDATASCTPGVPLASLAGTTVPLTAAQLHDRYPTPGDYIAKVDAAVETALAQGILLPLDAEKIRRDARHFDYTPLQLPAWPY